jgi:hypothetical protein
MKHSILILAVIMLTVGGGLAANNADQPVDKPAAHCAMDGKDACCKDGDVKDCSCKDCGKCEHCKKDGCKENCCKAGEKCTSGCCTKKAS